MNLTLSLILSEYMDMSPSISFPSAPKATISGLLFFTTSILPLENNFIYLCDSENIETALTENNGNYFFYIGEREDLPSNVVRFPPRYTPLDIVNRYNRIVHFFSAWDKNLHQQILEGCTLEEIIDQGSNIIQYPVQYFDNALNMIGTSRNHTVRVPEFEIAANLGYTPSDIFLQVQKSNLLNQVQNARTCILQHSAMKSDEYIIYRCHRVDHQIIGYSLIYCGPERPDQGYLDKCELYFSSLDLYYRLTRKMEQASGYMYENLLTALMTSYKSTDDKWVKDRLRISNLPARATFNLIKIEFTTNHTSISYLLNLLHKYFPTLLIYLYEGSIYLLMQASASATYLAGKSRLDHLFTQMDAQLNNYMFRCYISDTFFHISDLYYATIQCGEIQDLIQSLPSESTGKRYFYAHDYVLMHGYTYLEKKYNLNFLLWDKYKHVLHYDETHATHYLETLTCYLESNGDKTNVAENMHIHRNSVDNRLKKIYELFDLDVTDFRTLVQLYIAATLHRFWREKQ